LCFQVLRPQRSVEHGEGRVQTTRSSRANELIVRNNKENEVVIIDQSIGIQISRAAHGHGGIGAIENVVSLRENDEVGVVDLSAAV
jgi:hypothetical protein